MDEHEARVIADYIGLTLEEATALAEKQNPPFEIATVGLTGLNRLREST